MRQITLQQVISAIQSLENDLDYTRSILDKSLEGHIHNLLDEADARQSEQSEGKLANRLSELKKKLESFDQQVANFKSELKGYGVNMDASAYDNAAESTHEMMERMRHKGDAITLLNTLHNEVANTAQKQALLYKDVAEVANQVTHDKSNASLEELKKKMGYKK